jgi:hypothetical protein
MGKFYISFLSLFLMLAITACHAPTHYISSKSSSYFPVVIFLDEEGRFIYRETLDKNHAESYYFESGSYSSSNDTIYFTSVNIGLSNNSTGFSCGKGHDVEAEQSKVWLAVTSSKKLYLLREDETVFFRVA